MYVMYVQYSVTQYKLKNPHEKYAFKNKSIKNEKCVKKLYARAVHLQLH